MAVDSQEVQKEQKELINDVDAYIKDLNKWKEKRSREEQERKEVEKKQFKKYDNEYEMILQKKYDREEEEMEEQSQIMREY